MPGDTSDHPKLVGLYLGDLSHAGGLWQNWLPVFRTLGLQWVPLWDRSFLLEDVLAGIDVIVIPGGLVDSRSQVFGGEVGRRNLRHVVRQGTSVVGVCYGAAVVMASGAEQRVCHLGLIQGAALPPDGLPFEGPARIDYLGTGLPYAAQSQEIEHINGDMFGPGEYEVLGRFSDLQPGPFDPPPRQPIAGRPAVIGADYGRGRAVAFCSHPEYPISFRYEAVLSKVIAGELPPADAARMCDDLPRASAPNSKMLKCLFRTLPDAARAPYPAIPAFCSAEQVAYLATAQDLLLSRLGEMKRQLVGALASVPSPALEFVHALSLMRLQQAHDVVSAVDIERLADNPRDLCRAAACFILPKLYCGCDLPQFRKEARMDYLLDQLAQLKHMTAIERGRLAGTAARWALRIHIAALDRIICLRDR